MGDFNSILYMNERIGSIVTDAEVKDFQNCVDVCGLYDLVSNGAYFTWNNKQVGNARVFSRIDKVMANDEWVLNGPSGVVSFLPEGLYDHSPCLIEFGKIVTGGKRLKLPLKKLNSEGYGDIENVARVAKLLLENIKRNLQVDPKNEADDNTRFFHSFINARRAQNKVLRIKDRNGPVCGDTNTIEQAFIAYYQVLSPKFVQK
ncbi:uncharacterized protein LOC141630168 [Silene latifolia]|uniref:uncharacterized protein LOC141630168 n=1 Tax=Silene latifolia TaxID=37657 RepID=UPI003D777157